MATKGSRSYVVEVYSREPTRVGRLVRRYQVEAADSRDVLDLAFRGIRKSRAPRIVAVFDGTVGQQAYGVIAFGGNYTMDEWGLLRDALGGLDGVKATLRSASHATR